MPPSPGSSEGYITPLQTRQRVQGFVQAGRGVVQDRTTDFMSCDDRGDLGLRTKVGVQNFKRR